MKFTRSLLLFISLGIILLGFTAFNNLSYDYDVGNYTSNNAEKEEYNRVLSQFTQYDPETVVILNRAQGFNTIKVFRELETYQDQLYNLKGVKKITSLQTLDIPEKTTFDIRYRRALTLEDSIFNNQFDQLLNYPDIRQKFLSLNNTYLCFYIETDSSNENFGRDLQQSLSGLNFIDHYYVLGSSIQKEEAKEALATETKAISILTVAIMLLVFLLLIQSISRLLVITIITALNVSFVFILMFFLKIPITSLTAVVPGIIAILSFTDQMHISYHYTILRQELKSGKILHEKLFSSIGTPLLLTSMANLVGFVIFFANGGIERINDLALISTLGIIISYFISRLILPELLKTRISTSALEYIFKSKMQRLLNKTLNQSRAIMLLFFIISVSIFLVLMSHSKIDMHYYSKGSDKMKYEEASAVYDEHFQGIRDIEVIIEHGSTILSPNLIHFIASTEDYLIREYGCNNVFSMNTLIKRFERFQHSGKPAFYKLPKNINERYIQKIIAYRSDLGLGALVNENLSCTRIIGSLPDIGSYEGRKRTDALTQFLQQHNKESYAITIGGKAHMFDKSIHSLSQTIIFLLVLGMILVGIILGFIFKKFLLGLVTIWVNLLPIGFAFVMMALLNVSINPSSLFMITILIGVALDDSIYLLASFNWKKQQLNKDEFIKKIIQNAFPLFVTSIVISAAFLGLLISSNQLTFAFSIVMSSSLLFAFIADIILLPVLVKKIVA